MADTDDRTTSLLDFIAGMSPRDFDREIERVQRERARLAQLERLLHAARDVIRINDASMNFIEEINTAADAAIAGRPAAGEGDGHRSEHRGPGGPPTRTVVAALLREDPDRVWTAGEMFSELARRGLLAKRDSVRVMLQRLTKAGLAERVSHGRYKASRTTDDGLLKGVGADGDKK